MTCYAKHTAYQPSLEEWKCPKCGVGSEYTDNRGNLQEGFVIDCEGHVGDDNCEKLHDMDITYCHKCEKGWTGSVLAKKLMAKAHAITCPTCKGKGWVKGVKGE